MRSLTGRDTELEIPRTVYRLDGPAREAATRGADARRVQTLRFGDLPELYGLLGEAHQDLEKHNLAEGHYLRYLQLKPDAPDRTAVEAYLRSIQQGE